MKLFGWLRRKPKPIVTSPLGAMGTTKTLPPEGATWVVPPNWAPRKARKTKKKARKLSKLSAKPMGRPVAQKTLDRIARYLAGESVSSICRTKAEMAYFYSVMKKRGIPLRGKVRGRRPILGAYPNMEARNAAMREFFASQKAEHRQVIRLAMVKFGVSEATVYRVVGVQAMYDRYPINPDQAGQSHHRPDASGLGPA